MRVSLIGRMPGLQIGAALSLLRPKQWVKNSFVLAPLVFSGQFTNINSIALALIAAAMFCAAASVTYIINDIQDIDRDRLHPRKSKTRPLAAGIISVPAALMLMAGLCTALCLGSLVMPKVLAVCATYMALNVAYTFYLKHEPVLDIFTIALGFVLRVYAGATAIAVPVSGWMFITTLCLALYLAAMKRRQELKQNGSEARAVLGKYSVELVERYAELSGIGALVFYSQFVVTARPELTVTIPLVLFGLFRYWYIVEQTENGDCPTDALLADVQLFSCVALWVIACCWAILPMAV